MSKKKEGKHNPAAPAGPKSRYFPDASWTWDGTQFLINTVEARQFVVESVYGAFWDTDALNARYASADHPLHGTAAAYLTKFIDCCETAPVKNPQFPNAPSEEFARIWLDNIVDNAIQIAWNERWAEKPKTADRERFKHADEILAIAKKAFPMTPEPKFL